MHIKLLMVVLLLSCSKANHPTTKTAAELLTQKTWKLVSHGYDENANGKIEGWEDNLVTCETDNTYEFYVEGTGRYRDNELFCQGTIEQQFTWQFINNESGLDFLYANVIIKKLDEQTLIFMQDATDGQPAPYIITLAH